MEGKKGGGGQAGMDLRRQRGRKGGQGTKEPRERGGREEGREEDGGR